MPSVAKVFLFVLEQTGSKDMGRHPSPYREAHKASLFFV
jgi:hypothetical protein